MKVLLSALAMLMTMFLISGTGIGQEKDDFPTSPYRKFIDTFLARMGNEDLYTQVVFTEGSSLDILKGASSFRFELPKVLADSIPENSGDRGAIDDSDGVCVAIVYRLYIEGTKGRKDFGGANSQMRSWLPYRRVSNGLQEMVEVYIPADTSLMISTQSSGDYRDNNSVFLTRRIKQELFIAFFNEGGDIRIDDGLVARAKDTFYKTGQKLISGPPEIVLQALEDGLITNPTKKPKQIKKELLTK